MRVLGDRIRLTTGTQTLKAITGDLLTVPAAPHMLRAVDVARARSARLRRACD